MRLVGADELEDVAIGAAILGAGGGGDPYVGTLLARAAIEEHGPVTVVDVDEVPGDAVVVPAAMMGAPTVMLEKLPEGDELVWAFNALAMRLGRDVTHTVSVEVGGLNSTIPLVAAARLGLPLVDADAMGRAFPELQMCLPTLSGVLATPMAMADEKGNTAVIETIDNSWTERLARAVTIEMGCTALIALYVLSGAQVRDAMIPGTLTAAQKLGEAVREARRAHGDPIGAVVERVSGHRLFEGKVLDVSRRTEGGFARGEATLAGECDDNGSQLTLLFQNEHLVALRDGEAVVTTPDLIIVLASETGQPVTTESMRYGLRVTVLAAPCDVRWRTPAGLALVGPSYFGYELPYVPIEERA